ncbi:salivary endonuclease-like [Rhynchophorus ferrugineus]|uniref:salivary endonuclease-like n=1 Tax=Rhynchophorus ferrugineus TaxID=354439 RepID=UPI003FCD1BCF
MERKRFISASKIVLVAVLCISIVTIITVSLKSEITDGCEIHPLKFDLSPLIILAGTTTIPYPRIGEEVLRFYHGQRVEFACPGSEMVNGFVVLPASCHSQDEFDTVNGRVKWSQLYCKATIQSTIRYTGLSCEADGSEIEVGFPLEGDRFVRTMMICFDRENQMAHYSFINQTASINQRTNAYRPLWTQGSNIYDIDSVTDLYTRKNQRKTVNALVNLEANSAKYINNDYLSRGHLTAKADMFYSAQQNATFFMGNVAPQWQTLNGGNWNNIEIAVRDYGEQNRVNLMVWTGVHGIATLSHTETKDQVDLYLYVDELTNKKAIPVPAIFWKIVYNPNSQEGIALIGFNNPYTDPDPICSDVSRNITWLKLNKNTTSAGYCYVCTVDSFRNKVKNVPNVTVRGLLV